MKFDFDEKYMRLALNLAARGGRATMPNPMVGAVLASQEHIIAQGWHELCGGPHAEINALRHLKSGEIPPDATLYVNLEPCSHYGRTPPCVNRLIELGIKRVAIAQRDPNPRVNGAGVALLKSQQIEVIEGILEHEAAKLNRRFLTLHQKKRPYVILKWAQTADGFIAKSDYTSKWISSQSSRTLSHRWRSQEQAILIGKRTALHDDPALNVRAVEGINPTRFLIDRNLEVARTNQILADGCGCVIYNSKRGAIEGGLHYVKLDFKKEIVAQMLADMAQREILSVLVEGGSTTHDHFLTRGIWDEMRVFVAPETLFGDGIAAPTIDLSQFNKRQYGSDILLTLER